MKKLYISLSCLLMAATTAFAQETFDLLKYFQQESLGTARSMSMANALGAVGADLTAISINPAGLGIYRRGEATATLNMANTDMHSSQLDNNKFKTSFTNYGCVITCDMQEESSLAYFNMALTYNTKANFNRNTMIRQFDSPVSLLDNVVNDANLQNLAYKTYLLNSSYEPILKDGETVNYAQKTVEIGSHDAVDLALAFNYGYWFYGGISLGIEDMEYAIKSIYSEDFALGGSMNYTNAFSSSGTGLNLKIGAILRLFPRLRLGISYHTPTIYNMTDLMQDATMKSYDVLDDDNKSVNATESHNFDQVYYDYQMTSPQMLVLSAAYQLGSKAIVSVDYEHTDYSTMGVYDAYGFLYEDLKQDIKDKTNATDNIRVGIEWRANNSLSLRGGYAHLDSPVKQEVIAEYQNVYVPSLSPYYFIPTSKGSDVYSLGLGLKFGSWYFDFAYQYHQRKVYNYPFYNNTRADENGVMYNTASLTRMQQQNIAMSLGVRF